MTHSPAFSSKFWLVVALIIIPASAIAQKKYDIRFEPIKGSVFEYVIDTKMDQMVSGQPVKTDMGMDMRMTVTDIRVDVRTVESSIERFRMSAEAGAFNLKVDTKEPEPTIEDVKADPMRLMHKIFENVVGKSYTFQMNSRGKVLAVSGYEELMMKAIESVAWTEKMRASLKERLSGQFNNESIRKMLEQSFHLYPDRAVAIGESWSSAVNMDVMMDGTVASNYTLKSVENGKAYIEMSSNFDLSNPKMKMLGQHIGNLTIELGNGLIENMQTTMTGKGESDGMPVEMLMELTMKGGQVTK